MGGDNHPQKLCGNDYKIKLRFLYRKFRELSVYLKTILNAYIFLN
jgi:hypothetical protein